MRVEPAAMPGVLAETTRRYPRTLAQAFPVTEASPSGIYLVADRTSQPIREALRWAVALVMLGWLAWACLHGVEPLRP